MTDEELARWEGEIIKVYLPNLGKKMSKAIRKMCRQKGINIYNDNLRKSLEGVEAAIIRHRYTDYDSIVRKVGKERARFYIGQEQIT